MCLIWTEQTVLASRECVPHFDQRGEKYYDYRGGRTFYIEDVLYTASDRYLKMNGLDDLKEINSIKLANTGEFINFVQ